jgi:sporulation protein YlmC with PRC-barrel domain
MKVTTFVAAIGIALAALPLAWAQTRSEPQKDKPAITPPAATTPAEKIQPQWYTRKGDEMRASKLIGADVRNTANEDVGEINEVILDKDGKVAAVVLGVGGFLGMGERQVAVEFKSLRFAEKDGAPTVTIDATKDALKSAPEWKWAGNRSGTTGTGTAPTKQPAK